MQRNIGFNPYAPGAAAYNGANAPASPNHGFGPYRPYQFGACLSPAPTPSPNKLCPCFMPASVILNSVGHMGNNAQPKRYNPNFH